MIDLSAFPKKLCALVVAAAGLAAAPVAAQSQSYIRADCRPFVTSIDFDDDLHRRWYVTFWDGKCQGLSFCRSDAWNDGVGELLARASAANSAQVLREACQLGRLVGHEWARDNGSRKIDTDEVQAWGALLRRPGDPLVAIRRVKALADRELAGG